MKVTEKHANGASLEVEVALPDPTHKLFATQREQVFAFVENWRAGQPAKEPDDPERGKSGATAYFSGEQKRDYEHSSTWGVDVPVVHALSGSQISLRVGGL